MKPLVIISIVMFLFSCAPTFNRVDFKYTNRAHMEFQEAIIDFEQMDPERLIFALSKGFTARAFDILNRTKLDFFYKEAEFAGQCDAAHRDIYHQEFAAYRANNFSQYKAIDRKKPFSSRRVENNCKILEIVKDSDVNSWFLEVEVPQGNYSTDIKVPDVNSFFFFDGSNLIPGYGISKKTQRVHTSFSSRLYVWAWIIPGTQTTRVYLEARPVNGQVVSCDKCSIGHAWWQQANGHTEFKLVKQYVMLLQELKRSEDAMHRINKRARSNKPGSQL